VVGAVRRLRLEGTGLMVDSACKVGGGSLPEQEVAAELKAAEAGLPAGLECEVDLEVIPADASGLVDCAAIPAILAVQFAPDPTTAFILYAPAMLLINSPFGIAAGALPVIAPPTIRAQVAAINMLVGSFGMMLGPPLAGYFNTAVFPGPEGVRYSIITLVLFFGILGCSLLWLGRKHYAESYRRAQIAYA
jgi:hypothetical protein